MKKIILLENIKGLGIKGDLIKVKLGYLRNFLIKKYKITTNINNINNNIKSIIINNNNNDNNYNKYDFKKIYEEISNIKNIIFYRKSNKSGKLFDSISSKNIISYIINNISFCKKKFIKIFLNKNIKYIGNYYTKISLNNKYNININIIIKDK